MSDEHGQTMRALGLIEGKVDGLYPTINRLREDHEHLEVRTRTLENWRWYILGCIAVALLVVGFVVR